MPMSRRTISLDSNFAGGQTSGQFFFYHCRLDGLNWRIVSSIPSWTCVCLTRGYTRAITLYIWNDRVTGNERWAKETDEYMHTCIRTRKHGVYVFHAARWREWTRPLEQGFTRLRSHGFHPNEPLAAIQDRMISLRKSAYRTVTFIYWRWSIG